MSSIGLAVGLVCGSAVGLFLVGLYPAGLDPAYGMAMLALALAAVLLTILAWGNRHAVWATLLTAFTLVGCGRALLIHSPVTPSDLAYYNTSPAGPTVSVTGEVSVEPRFSDRSQRLRISARNISIVPYADVASGASSSRLAIHGDLYAIVPRYPEYQIGEMLSLSGHLTQPPTYSDFDYATYLARQGVFSYMDFPKVANLGRTGDSEITAFIAGQRKAARNVLQSVVPEPQASIAVGVITGDRSSLPDDVQTAFRRSGTTHILAISGENISLAIAMTQ